MGKWNKILNDLLPKKYQIRFEYLNDNGTRKWIDDKKVFDTYNEARSCGMSSLGKEVRTEILPDGDIDLEKIINNPQYTVSRIINFKIVKI